MVHHNNLKLTLSSLHLCVRVPLAQPGAVLSGCNYQLSVFYDTCVRWIQNRCNRYTLQKTKRRDMCIKGIVAGIWQTDKCVLPDNLSLTYLATQTCLFSWLWNVFGLRVCARTLVHKGSKINLSMTVLTDYTRCSHVSIIMISKDDHCVVWDKCTGYSVLMRAWGRQAILK